MPLEERVACLTEAVADQMADAAYYYWGEKLSNPLENAMKSYGSQAVSMRMKSSCSVTRPIPCSGARARKAS